MIPLELLQAEGAALRDLVKAARRLRADHPVIAGLHDLRAKLPEEHRHHIDALLAEHGPATKPARAPKPVHPLVEHFVHRFRSAGHTEAAHRQVLNDMHAHPELKAAHWTAVAHAITGHGKLSRAAAQQKLAEHVHGLGTWDASQQAVKRAYRSRD